eukprot:SAG31_NODE_8292_length_1479_cov_7.124638_1_plen_162_part_10
MSLMLPFIHSRATVSGRLWPLWSPPVTVMGLGLRASGTTSDYTYPIKSNRNPSYGASIGMSSVLHESAGRHHQTNRNPSHGASIGVSSMLHESVGRHHQTNRNPSHGASIWPSNASVLHESEGRHHQTETEPSSPVPMSQAARHYEPSSPVPMSQAARHYEP